MTGAFAGQRAIVTGGASGIGLATARALAAAGADVLVTDVDDRRGQAAADEIGARYARLDVARPEEWSALLETLPELGLLHLNAGIYDIELGDITSISEARYRAYLGVNVDGVFYGLRATAPLLARSRGAVVVTGSMAGIGPLASNPVYALTKFALTGLVRSVHADMLARGIRLNMLCPGAVVTPIMGNDSQKWYEERGVAASGPEDIAATVLDLLGSNRSGEIVLQMAPQPPRTLTFPPLAAL